MSIHQALAARSLQWRAVRGSRPGYDLLAGDEPLATLTQGQVELGERQLLRTQPQKRSVALVDVATGSRVASIREMANTRAAINARSGRYRMSKRAVLPVFLEVTADLGGPQILQMLHLGSVFRVRAGRDLDTAPGPEVDLLVVLTGLQVLDLLAPTAAVTAPAA